MLKRRADLQPLLYLILMITLLGYQWSRPQICDWRLYPATLLLAFLAAVISHNHNHVGLWRSRTLNRLTSYVIGFFYGFPAFAWVPTHNQNHHRYNNGAGDRSASPWFFQRNSLLALLVYPPMIEMAQFSLLTSYVGTLWSKHRRRFWGAMSEFAVFFGLMGLGFALDWRKAVVLLVLPQIFSKYLIQCVGYFQHIDCVQDSDWDHSRNFVGPFVNALLMNNGYHTVHHFQAGVHWADLPALHAAHCHKIATRFQVPNMAVWMATVFLIAPLRALAQPITAAK